MKKFFKNMKLWKKLMAGPVITVVFFLVLAGTCFTGLFSLKGAVDEAFNIRFKNYQDISTVINDLTVVKSNIYKVFSWKQAGVSDARIDTLRKEQTEGLKRITETLKTLSASKTLTKAEKAFYEGALKDMEASSKKATAAMDMLSGDVSLANTMMAPAEEAFQTVQKSLQQLSEQETKMSKETHVSAQGAFSRALTVGVVVVVLAVLASLAINIVISRTISSMITKTVAAINDMATGDLTRAIDVDSRDEIGQMASQFNTSVARLNEVITRFAEGAHHLTQAAGVLQSSAIQMATGSEEVTAQVTAVAGASEEMSATSTDIAQSCMRAAESSRQADEAVTQGEAVIREAVTVMGDIAGRVKDSAVIIGSLGKRSDDIGEIIELINDIADQTNLLALNAAIEAARAGEHGRGFAVVADEVRKLAERTTEATKEIGETIKAMQTETRQAVTFMEESVDKVETGSDAANRSGEALQHILHLITAVTQQINQIAVAAEEEMATTNEITSNMHQVAMVMNDTSRRVHENAGEAAQLAQLAQELKEITSTFKLRS